MWFSERSTAKSFRNSRHTDWELCRTMMVQELCDRDLKYKSVVNQEESVTIVGQAIRLAFESSCTLKVPKGKQGAPWWSWELQGHRAGARWAFIKAHFSGDQQD